MSSTLFRLSAPAFLIAGALLVGCQESTAPKSGIIGSRPDRGLNIDSQSPSVPNRSSAGVGYTSGSNLPEGENAPVPAPLRNTQPPPASPAADRAPGTGRGDLSPMPTTRP